MDQVIDTARETLRTLVIWEVNAWLVFLYVAWEHLTALLVLATTLTLALESPVYQRHFLSAISLLATLAALLTPAPAPVILAAMSVAGYLAVRVDRFSPDALRWRVAGGLALYAAAALGYLAYGHYLAGVDAAEWARALGGQEEAMQVMAQGRAFVNTLATWGLWLIIPLGYFSLLVQGLLVHPPLPGGSPENIIETVRTRGGTR